MSNIVEMFKRPNFLEMFENFLRHIINEIPLNDSFHNGSILLIFVSSQEEQ